MSVAPTAPAIARFWAKVDKDGPDPAHVPGIGNCWVWMASRLPNGYGQFGAGASAHRFSYELATGTELPRRVKGENSPVVMHLCDNPVCVRPSHLRLGTYKENVQDAIRKRRFTNCAITHCIRGHAFDEANTGRRRNGTGRICRACQRIRSAEWEAKQSRGSNPRCKA